MWTYLGSGKSSLNVGRLRQERGSGRGVDKKAGVEVKTAWGQEQMHLCCRVRYREFSVLSPHLRLVRLG